MVKDKPAEIGRIKVERREMRIEDLENKVQLAVQYYHNATDKFRKGKDSIKEWNSVVKILKAQQEEIDCFVAMAHHNLGIVYGGRDEIEKSVEYFKKAVALDPEYALAYFNLGVMQKKLGNVLESETALQRAKELGYSTTSK